MSLFRCCGFPQFPFFKFPSMVYCWLPPRQHSSIISILCCSKALIFFEMIECNNNHRNNSNNLKSLVESCGKLAIKQMKQQGTHTHTNNKRDLKLQGMEREFIREATSLSVRYPFHERGYLFYLVTWMMCVRE